MASLKSAIKAKCINCSYDDKAPGTALAQVESCTVRSCALWEVRPVTVATLNARRKCAAAGAELDLDLNALVDGLDDEDTEVQAEFAV